MPFPYLFHRTLWNPSMTSVLVGRRLARPVIDGQSLLTSQLRGLYVLTRLLRAGGHVLIVNTHPDLLPLLRTLHKEHEHPQLSYCFSKWIGGTLTNWRQVTRSMLSYAGFEAHCAPFVMRHGGAFPRYRRIQRTVHGYIHASSPRVRFPDMIVLLQVAGNTHILREAAHMHVPVCAFVEASTSLQGIHYPILHRDLYDLRVFCQTLVQVAPLVRK